MLGRDRSFTGFRTYLPDCRAYELVTPPYKEGAVVLTEPGAISPDGEHVIVGVPGSFAGEDNLWFQLNANPDIAVYELSRMGSGWQASALTPPATTYPYSSLRAASASDELATTLWGLDESTLLYKENLYLREPDGSFVLVGPGSGPEVADQELAEGSRELQFVGGSSDLSHMLFRVEAEQEAGGHSNLWPGDRTVFGADAESLYEYVGTGNAAPTLVGVSDGATVVNGTRLASGTQISRCGTELGGGGREGSDYNAVSASGETVFFTAHNSTSTCTVGPDEPPVNEIYARVGESATVKISEPTKEDCAACQTSSTETPLKSAIFEGASKDGKETFFLTEQELLPGRKGMNLYEYDFEGPAGGRVSLVSACSAEPSKCSPEAMVQGVVRISQSGAQVYFAAQGKLTGEDGIAGRSPETTGPQEGAENLYVYDTESGQTTFVATLLTKAQETALEGEEESERHRVGERSEQAAYSAFYRALSRGASGEEAFVEYAEAYSRTEQALAGTLGPAGTLAEDRKVWATEDARPAQATPNGRFLLFASSADLTPDDTSRVPQLFEYDALARRLTRVSIGQGSSYDGDGNVSDFHEAPQIPEQNFVEKDLPTEAGFRLAISADGSTVFFTSAAGLAPGALNAQPSVFEYRDGSVYLISDGRDSTATNAGPSVQLYGIAGAGEPEARDAFFTTADSLVPQDGETQVALYDARVLGGFPAAPLARVS